jgi:hypothetical protein
MEGTLALAARAKPHHRTGKAERTRVSRRVEREINDFERAIDDPDTRAESAAAAHLGELGKSGRAENNSMVLFPAAV